jgi:formate dehydrogenase iron-sulfur subunit
MSYGLSRRAFLKGSFFAAGTIATGSGFAVAGDFSSEKNEPLATLLDIRKCVGCEECVYACQEANASKYPNPEKPFPKMYPSSVPVQDWSDKRNITDRLTPYNWLYIQHASVNLNGKEVEITIPRRCMHCENPPCVKLCPWGAAKQEDNGLSRIDSDLCLGGSKCKNVCPWHIPERQTGTGLYLDLLPAFAGNGVMYKCDRCYQRIKQGEVPACIEACPYEVQSIGPRSLIIEHAHKIAKETGGYIYGEHENGGTNTIYISPVPFEELNAAIEKEAGKPHLGSVKDMMADGNNIVKAMVIAPVAGIAAAIGKFYLSSK